MAVEIIKKIYEFQCTKRKRNKLATYMHLAFINRCVFVLRLIYASAEFL